MHDASLSLQLAFFGKRVYVCSDEPLAACGMLPEGGPPDLCSWPDRAKDGAPSTVTACEELWGIT